MADNCFPQIECDVFLSHSHKDREEVLGITGWLKKGFRITAFIDSSIWGNSVKKVDDEYCYDEDRHMYNLRNYSTSHVHMLLSMALLKMIDKVEALMVNTPNEFNYFYSGLIRIQTGTEGKMIFNEARSLDIGYDVQKYLDEKIKLGDEDLEYWSMKYLEFISKREQIYPLDCLYAQFNIGTNAPSTFMR